MQHTRFSESPDTFHLWTGIATIAGALRRRVWIDQLHFQWTPNFYVVLVGPPGVAAKSTSIRAGISLLEKIPGIFFGPQSMTWQALNEALRTSQEGVEVPGIVEPQIMSCVTIGVSELGTFLRTEDKELVDFLVAMWDGQKEIWRRQTKGEGETVIHNPWLNIIACTTPAWLKDNFPDVLVGGGLTSRMVFVYADTKRQYVPYPADLVAPATYLREADALVADLAEIANMAGEYTFTPEAKAWGCAWYTNHWKTTQPENISSTRFAGYKARKQTHLHKLAIVFAAAKRNTLCIEVEDLQEAEAALRIVEHDMDKVFASIGVNDQAQVANEVVSMVKNIKEISYKKLWQLCFNRIKPKDFTDSIQAGIQSGILAKHVIGTDIIIRYVKEKERK
jgi:Protein of unknown function (DUF3987)